jgi:hypothetical protein
VPQLRYDPGTSEIKVRRVTTSELASFSERENKVIYGYERLAFNVALYAVLFGDSLLIG